MHSLLRQTRQLGTEKIVRADMYVCQPFLDVTVRAAAAISKATLEL